MNRSRKILAVCHCLLNPNAKVMPLATHPGICPALEEPIARGAGLVQLPCPETAFLGLRRWGMTREQYDTPAYRRASREMLRPALDQLWAFADAGYELLGVVGVDGSPSCGVFLTCEGFHGGEPCGPGADVAAQCRAACMLPGRGVYIDVLAGMLAEYGLTPPLLAVDETSPTVIKNTSAERGGA